MDLELDYFSHLKDFRLFSSFALWPSTEIKYCIIAIFYLWVFGLMFLFTDSYVSREAVFIV